MVLGVGVSVMPLGCVGVGTVYIHIACRLRCIVSMPADVPYVHVVGRWTAVGIMFEANFLVSQSVGRQSKLARKSSFSISSGIYIIHLLLYILNTKVNQNLLLF